MEKVFLGDDGQKSLIILFLGWGFHPESFVGLHKPGFNILLLAGYEGLNGQEIDHEICRTIREHNADFKEVIVVAWSFGVKPAADFLVRTSLPVTLRLAVNGTEYHIDSHRGIPPEIFNGTLAGLSERTLAKFRLRCAGSREMLGKLKEVSPDIERLRDELEWFGSLTPAPSLRDNAIWDKIVVGEEDRIFPMVNQLNAWEDYDVFTVAGMAHIPDFQWLIDTFIVDKAKVVDKFSTASQTYTTNAVAQQLTAGKLYDKFRLVFDQSELKKMTTEEGHKLSLLELGYGDGTFTRTYLRDLSPLCKLLTLSDINRQEDSGWIKERFDGHPDINIEILQADAESEDFHRMAMAEHSRDIIFSSSMFQWLNSPRQMLKVCAEALRHRGIIALSFYGPGTLKEVNDTVGSGLKYHSPEWMVRIARECNLNIESLDSEEETIVFDTPTEALRHLRLTGVNALPATPSPAKARQLLNHWPLTPDGKASLTFRPVYMILSKP